MNLRHLKSTLGLEVLKCKSESGVRQELAMMMIVYNLVCGVMRQAGQQQGVGPLRISFKDALDWLSRAKWSDPIPKLRVHPLRSRCEPRVRKRRSKSYKLMNRPRAELRQKLQAKQATNTTQSLQM